MKRIAVTTAVLLSGCATAPAGPTPQDAFFTRLSSLCGRALSGKLVSNDAQDADMAGKPMVTRFGPCARDEVRINLRVGGDASRNWVVTRTGAGLRLKHIHLHDDGSEDELSRYGGDTASTGTERRQEFPADAFSKEQFTRRNIPQSVTNVWAIEVAPPSFFAYELRRPGRYFRVELDTPATP